MARPQRTPRWAVVALVATAACQRTPNTPTQAASAAPAAEAASSIDAAQLRQHVARLASDELEGRGPGAAGDRRTRAFLAEQLAALGAVLGAGGVGWEQPVELVGIT